MNKKCLLLLMMLDLSSCQVVPCQGSDNKLSLSWTPRVISRGVLYELKYKYNGKSIVTTKARVCFTVWLDDMENMKEEDLWNEDPFYQNCDVHTCEDMDSLLKNLFPPMVSDDYCPLTLVNTDKEIEYTQRLDQAIDPLDGDFIIHTNMTDINTGKLYLCLTGKISMME